MFSFVIHPLIVCQVFPNHRQDKKNISHKPTGNSNLHKQVVILVREGSDYKFQGQIQDFEKEGALVIPVEKQLGDSRGAVCSPSRDWGKVPEAFTTRAFTSTGTVNTYVIIASDFAFLLKIPLANLDQTKRDS